VALMAGTFTQRIDELEKRLGTGTLTGSVTVDQVYAKYQHERMELHHPKGGQAKYLQAPLMAHFRDYLTDYAKTVLSDGGQAAMKRSIAIDNLANLEIQAANQINQSLQIAAPGSAPIIEAQADAWLVRANAYTQAAIADLMRVRAIDLADTGANIKSGATSTTNLGQELINLLKRR